MKYLCVIRSISP